MRLDGNLAFLDHLRKRVILGIETLENICGKLYVTKWLADGGKLIGEAFDLVEENGDRVMILAGLIKLCTKSHVLRRGLCGETGLQRISYLMRRSSK